MPQLALYALLALTAVPLFVDIARPWLLPFLVLYAVVAIVLAVGVEMEREAEKKKLVAAEKRGGLFAGVKVVQKMNV
jgi:predicted ABC-type exoprotein transport system permease subunit